MKSKKHVEYYKNNDIEYEEWKLSNGDLHREDGPARIRYYKNGNKCYEQWHKNGKSRREGGPSFTSWNESGNIICEIWSKAGKMHREEGPARICYNKNGSVREVRYWINGEELTEEEWKIYRLPNTKIKRALYD